MHSATTIPKLKNPFVISTTLPENTVKCKLALTSTFEASICSSSALAAVPTTAAPTLAGDSSSMLVVKSIKKRRDPFLPPTIFLREGDGMAPPLSSETDASCIVVFEQTLSFQLVRNIRFQYIVRVWKEEAQCFVVIWI